MTITGMKNQSNSKTFVVSSRTQKKNMLPKNPGAYDTRLSTLSEFSIPHCSNAFYKHSRGLVGTAIIAFSSDRNVVSPRKAPTDWSIQRVVSTSIWFRFLQQTHHSLLQGKPAERKMYDSLRQDIYCLSSSWKSTTHSALLVSAR